MNLGKIISRFMPKRYLSLLAAFIFMFFVYPVVSNYFNNNILFHLIFTLIILTSVYSLSRDIKFLVYGIVLAIPALFLMWLAYFTDNLIIIELGLIYLTLFLVYIMVSILTNVMKAKMVTADTIGGAVCVYLLIGLIFGIIYVMIYNMDPGSFKFPEHLVSKTEGDAVEKLPYSILTTYFSFITITTVGYGDITPINKLARSLCALEGLIGQLYLTILVARFVGLYIAHSMMEKDNNEDLE